MPVWFGLAGLLGWNYSRHLRGKSTLCSSGRPVIPPPMFIAAWATLTGWLIPHFCKESR